MRDAGVRGVDLVVLGRIHEASLLEFLLVEHIHIRAQGGAADQGIGQVSCQGGCYGLDQQRVVSVGICDPADILELDRALVCQDLAALDAKDDVGIIEAEKAGVAVSAARVVRWIRLFQG